MQILLDAVSAPRFFITFFHFNSVSYCIWAVGMTDFFYFWKILDYPIRTYAHTFRPMSYTMYSPRVVEMVRHANQHFFSIILFYFALPVLNSECSHSCYAMHELSHYIYSKLRLQSLVFSHVLTSGRRV